MFIPGAVALSGVRLYDPFAGLTEIERLVWQRIAAPVFTPAGGAAWDSGNVYLPTITRTFDYETYVDPDGFHHMFYVGGFPKDESGLALGTDFDAWTRYGTVPIWGLGGVGDPDYGDAQITSAFHDGVKINLIGQGNANGGDTGGDEVTLCWSTLSNAKVLTKYGTILARGSGGDALDQYAGKLIPAGHDGLPRIFYTGQDANSVRGLMMMVSLSGDPMGPYTRVSEAHLFRDGSTFLGDARYEGGLYHIIYSPITGGIAGLWYANSPDGITFTIRRQLLARRIGEWDSAPLNGSWLQLDGVDYLFFGSSSSIGIGYVYA